MSGWVARTVDNIGNKPCWRKAENLQKCVIFLYISSGNTRGMERGRIKTFTSGRCYRVKQNIFQLYNYLLVV